MLVFSDCCSDWSVYAIQVFILCEWFLSPLFIVCWTLIDECRSIYFVFCVCWFHDWIVCALFVFCLKGLVYFALNCTLVPSALHYCVFFSCFFRFYLFQSSNSYCNCFVVSSFIFTVRKKSKIQINNKEIVKNKISTERTEKDAKWQKQSKKQHKREK